MKDLRKILVTGLVASLSTATSRTIYTKVPITATFPYIFISDIYQTETGAKDAYAYELECLIQIVHDNLESLTALYDDMDKVLGIINNGSPFSLTSPYKIHQCTLINSSDTEILTETSVQNIGLIRLNFLII